MRAWRVIVAAAAAAAPLLAFAAPANAALDAPCEASGTVRETGESYDAATTDEVELPAEGDLDWTASVPEGDGEREVDGYVKLDLPAPLPDPTLGEWSGTSSSYSNADEYHWELPGALKGLELRVYGEHNEPGISCAGEVTVTVEGGGLGNPATLAFIALAVIAVLNVFLAVWVYA